MTAVTVKPPLSPHAPDLGEEVEPATAADLLGGHRLKERSLVGVELDSDAVPGLHLVDVVIDGGTWSNLQAREATLERVEATGLDAIGIQLPEATLHDCTFAEARLNLASFRHSTLERVAFRDCRLEEADFYGATLRSVSFERCVLAGATIAEATFERCELRGCELDALDGLERLAGTRMPIGDVIQIAALLAAASGIHVVD
jgi:uncharacterized protein YjbI with pentapeptide repeats